MQNDQNPADAADPATVEPGETDLAKQLADDAHDAVDKSGMEGDMAATTPLAAEGQAVFLTHDGEIPPTAELEKRLGAGVSVRCFSVEEGDEPRITMPIRMHPPGDAEFQGWLHEHMGLARVHVVLDYL